MRHAAAVSVIFQSVRAMDLARTMRRAALAMALAILLFVLPRTLHATAAVDLLGSASDNTGWTFDHGQEFPGARGDLKIQKDDTGKLALQLHGDFTAGGLYVQASCNFSQGLDLNALSFRAQGATDGKIGLRLVDATGQCHQIALKLKNDAAAQSVIFPVAEFFAKRGSPAAVAGVGKYESWGGAKDGNWHAPCKSMHLLIGPSSQEKIRTVVITELAATLTPAKASPDRASAVTARVSLEDIIEDETTWAFSNGQEFKGAKGSLVVDKTASPTGQPCLKLSGDFTGGGAYVEATRDLKSLDLGSLRAIHFLARTDNVTTITVRLIDATGQCHQTKGVKLDADGQWHPVTLKLDDVINSEHWGGAKDNQWHDPAAMFALLLTVNSDKTGNKQPVLFLRDFQAETSQEAVAQPAAFKCDFEEIKSGAMLPQGWNSAGRVVISSQSDQPFKGQHALLLDRPFAEIEKPCHVSTAPFPVKAGTWQIDAAARSELVSPDASFRGVLSLELLDAAGKVVNAVTLADLFGQRNWTPVNKRVDVPGEVTQARFRAELYKAQGKFWIDELAASFLAPVLRKDNRITRVMLGSDRLGNLFFPEDTRVMRVTLEASKPLAPEQLNFTWSVHTYWGAELTPPAQATLTKGAKKQGVFEYAATLDLSSLPLEVGPYYEVHVDVPQISDAAPFHQYTSFAILPLAITKQYKPEQVPFTTRSWDNRMGIYMELSDRLGIRVAGVWGTWNGEPPYAASAPSIEVARKLGMGVLTGTPAHAIEYHLPGYEKYDETAMKQGVRNWLEKYATQRPIYINLGNEPHGTGERVIEQVRAYKAIYDEVKKFDPTITVVATSVPPTEEYFQAGYQNACDAYDFHVYESPSTVRQSIEAYRAMARRYNADKPIWSTEIGLNSHGLSRHAVAVDLVRKFATFFAAGGANISWFGIMYPDPQAKIFDDSSSAHNVFDCRYNKYAPKLDAIAYYNMVNAIAIKQFTAESTYDLGVQATLFRDADGRCLQVLWTEKGRVDVTLPLGSAVKAGEDVQLIYVEGRRTMLKADDHGAITLSVREDPVLVLYQGGASAALAEKLVKSPVSIAAMPENFVRGEKARITIARAPESVELFTPLAWQVERTKDGSDVHFTITPAVNSKVREGELVVRAGPSTELVARAPVAGPVSIQVLPEAGDPVAAVVRIVNNSTESQRVDWKVSLLNQRVIRSGLFSESAPATAFFTGAVEGQIELAPRKATTVRVPMSGVDSLTLYRVLARVADSSGRLVEHERWLGGFASVPRVKRDLQIDANLDKPEWVSAPVARIDRAEQRQDISRNKMQPWKGPEDLSADVRYLWNEKSLFIAVRVKDDVHRNVNVDADLWNGDGLQLLIDPCRALRQKAGKYDLGFALTQKGSQSWCFLSGSSGIPTGPMPEVRFAARAEAGGMCYEIAIPWKYLTPFVPEPGANLGLTVAVNEDDGAGRFGFFNWFGDVQSKSVDAVGDLILLP